MNLLPSDPLYEMIMADQCEENPYTILSNSFRTKIYCLSSQQDSWNKDWDNNYIESIDDYFHDNLVLDERDDYVPNLDNIYLINNIYYPDNRTCLQNMLPYNDAYGWGFGDETWIDPHMCYDESSSK